MRVLLTGAGGSIGRVVSAGLAEIGHTVVSLDRAPQPTSVVGEWWIADCADPAAVAAVFAEASIDAVVHLAGHPDEASLADSFTSHVVTTAALLDAMVSHGVRRFVYASSNHAVGRTPRSPLLSTDDRPRPDTFYGVSKVAAEALLSLYADRYGLDVVACRIGSFGEAPHTTRQLSTWLSPGDCVRMIEACLVAPSPGYAVIYGISANSRAWWDLEPGRTLGYEPEDDAEGFAAAIPASDSDADEASYVGGPFALTPFFRAAFD